MRDSNAVVRNNTEKCPVHFAQFPAVETFCSINLRRSSGVNTTRRSCSRSQFQSLCVLPFCRVWRVAYPPPQSRPRTAPGQDVELRFRSGSAPCPTLDRAAAVLDRSLQRRPSVNSTAWELGAHCSPLRSFLWESPSASGLGSRNRRGPAAAGRAV